MVWAGLYYSPRFSGAWVALPLGVIFVRRTLLHSVTAFPAGLYPVRLSRGAGAVVVPAGDGLVPPSLDGPVQREGEASAGDQPGGVLPGETGEPGGLGDRQPDGGDAGRAGLAAATGTGASSRGISRSASLISPWCPVSLVSCPVPGSWMWPVRALRMAAARAGRGRPGRCGGRCRSSSVWGSITRSGLAWAWPGQSCGLGSSLSDLLGGLPARIPSARLHDGASPA